MGDDFGKTRVFTFYSYKGGVGRTMAVANVACQLANRHGKNVICIDWDLEAPGLHHYFGYSDEDLAGRVGLLDYLLDFKWQVTQGDKGKCPELRNYLVELKDEDRQRIKFGSVRLMHCGRTDHNYMAHVAEFDWNEFYEKFDGWRVIEAAKKQLLDEADVILIDARAGQAEVGGTPTIQIPDAVVLLFTCNTQSLHGADHIARNLVAHPFRRDYGGPPKLLLVPARVFSDRENFKRWLDEDAQPVFDHMVRDKVVAKADQPKGLRQCVIPVDPNFAVRERLPILEEPTDLQDQETPDINKAYVTLAQAIENLHLGRAAWSATTEGPTVSRRSHEVDDLRRELSRAVDRGDESTVAHLQFQLAQKLIQHTRLAEATSLLETSLAYSRRANNAMAIGAILHELGRIKRGERKYDAAWHLFSESLRFSEHVGDRREQRVTLQAMAVVRFEQQKLKESWELCERALRLADQGTEIGGQALALQGMGRVRAKQGRANEALDLFKRALKCFESSGDSREQAITLHQMGKLLLAQRQFADATQIADEGLALASSIDDEKGIAAFQDLKTAIANQEAKSAGNQDAPNEKGPKRIPSEEAPQNPGAEQRRDNSRSRHSKKKKTVNSGKKPRR